MLAGQFVHAAFQRLPQPEIIAVEGEHLAAEDGVEHPIGQVDADFRHSAGFGVAEDVPAVDQPEARGVLLAAGLDVGADAGAAQAVEGGDELLVAAAVVVSVGGHQQVEGLDVKRAVRLLAGVHLGDELADAVDEDVLVVDRRQAERAGDDRDFDAVMLVFADARSGLVASEKMGCSIDPMSSLGMASVTSQMKKSWIG